MSSIRKPRVAAIQMACTTSKQQNLDAALDGIAEAARQGADVVCLQELFHGQYPCQTEDHSRFDDAEPIPGPISKRLAEAARTHGLVLVASIFERRAAGLYHNSAVVLDANGEQVGLYRKMHIPDDPLYYEKFYFTPGDLGFRAFDTQAGCVGVCICWDQWFPEAARLTALKGAEMLFYPTAIGWLPNEKERYGASQHAAWETMLRSHAIANGCYVIAPNRVGREGELEFWGASLIVDPYGQVVARAGHQEPSVLIAECDLQLIETARTHWPFFRDRRVDEYAGLTKRWAGGG